MIVFDKDKLQKVKDALLCMQRYSWEQGVAAQAFLESGDVNLVVLMAKEASLRQSKDGRLAVMGGNTGVTDPASNGVAVLYAAKLTGDSILSDAASKMLDYLLLHAPKTKEGILCHLDDSRQVWVDSFYMAPPFLAASGHIKEAVKQIEGFRKLLWNGEKKLYSHMWDDDKDQFARKDFWGVGNGWAAAGITRVILSLPENMCDIRQKLSAYLKEGIDGCISYLRDDGFFHDIIDDPSTFVETNLSQMLSYSIYKGVKGGWLDNGYLKYADSMRIAAYSMVDCFGLVQGVCSSPCFNSPGTASEGQAFFLLMEAAANDI
jgi:unsaturated rhamnogalacturonyl hydrolase